VIDNFMFKNLFYFIYTYIYIFILHILYIQGYKDTIFRGLLGLSKNVKKSTVERS
jgi:hypothetical protein